MCYVCNCFAWSLDVVQRAITFCLTCFATCVVCFGLVVTVIAGVAFGYNYSFAEFITHTKSDVTVYMRRGQFYDHPDIAPAPVRRMGNADDAFSTNITSEYEEQAMPNKDSESLSKKWLKDQDAREYAIKLTKYKGIDKIYVDEPERAEQKKMEPFYKTTLPPTRRLANIQAVIPTTVWRRGSSQIVLRKFLPLKDITAEDYHTRELNDDVYRDSYGKYKTRPSEIEFSERQTEKNQPDIRIRFDDIPERKLLPLSNIATNSYNDQDDLIEEGNEDNIIYKPV